jgi:uncharacterized membrane protein
MEWRMKPALRIIAILIGWYALSDAFGLIRAIHAGIGEDYVRLYVFTASLSISIQLALVAIMLLKTDMFLEFLGVDDRKLHIYGSAFMVNALAVMLSLYMFIEGATFAITAYATARVELAEAGIPYGNYLTDNLFDWNWEDFIHGVTQALISGAILIGMIAHNNKLKPSAKAPVE